MSRERFTLPVAVFLLLERDDKLLLMRRFNTGWQNGHYDVVAGHVEGNESLTAALQREAKEEVGITLDAKDLHFAHLVHSFSPEDSKEYMHVFFKASKWQGEPTIMEPHKCDDLQWFALNELPAKLTTATQNIIHMHKAKQPYAELGFTEA